MPCPPTRSRSAAPTTSPSSRSPPWSSSDPPSSCATSSATSPTPDDLFADLAYRTRVAQEITYGRWCVVADILRTGATTSWAEIAAALNMTEPEARTGFHTWMTGQLNLRHRTSPIGLTEAESTHLRTRSEGMTLVTP